MFYFSLICACHRSEYLTRSVCCDCGCLVALHAVQLAFGRRRCVIRVIHSDAICRLVQCWLFNSSPDHMEISPTVSVFIFSFFSFPRARPWQTNGVNGEKKLYTGMWDCMKQILKREVRLGFGFVLVH